jgi:hypothetical protein
MPYPVNPMQLIQMIRQGKNPQQLLTSILAGQAGTNPISANLLNMVQNNQYADIEKFARNYFAANGLDFDKEFTAFKQRFGL